MGLAHLSAMPAIQWKLQNLAKLKAVNPAKFEDQSHKLAEKIAI